MHSPFYNSLRNSLLAVGSVLCLVALSATQSVASGSLKISNSIYSEMTIGAPIDWTFEMEFDPVENAPTELEVSFWLFGAADSVEIAAVTLPQADPGRFQVHLTSDLPDAVAPGPHQAAFVTEYWTSVFPHRDDSRLLVITASHDINTDGFVNIGDATYSIQYIFSDGPTPLPTAFNSDFDCNGAVNIGDVTKILSHIFAGAELPCITPAGSHRAARMIFDETGSW